MIGEEGGGRGGRGGEKRERELKKVIFSVLGSLSISKFYFFPGLPILKETVYPVVIAKGFGVRRFGSNTHMCCCDLSRALVLSKPQFPPSEGQGQYFLLLVGCWNAEVKGSMCRWHGSCLPFDELNKGLKCL